MSYSVHVHTPDPQSSDPATAGTARTGNRAAYGRILALALPTFGQLIAEPTFVLIDTAIVGHIGVSALAGLSIGSTIILTAVGLCIFLAYSTTAQVAHLLGAGRRREGLQAGIDGLWLALGIGIVLAAALFAGARPLCVALRGTGETLDQAVAYTQTVVLGAPGMLLVYAANGIFRGLQKVRITLVAAVCGAVLNTMLDVLFVFGFGWGIAGSGAATMIAQWFMGLFLTVPAVLWAKADGAALRPRLSGIAAAGFQAVNSSWNFAMNMLDSVGIAGQTLVGAAMGAGDRARTLRLTRATGRAGLAAGAAIGCGFAVAGLFVGRLFSPNPHVQLLVAAGMVTMGAFLPLQGWMMALDGILIGARDFRYLAITCPRPCCCGRCSISCSWAAAACSMACAYAANHGSVRPPSNDRPATALAALRNTHLDIAFASAEHHMIMASAPEDGRRHAEGDSAPNQMTSEYSHISKA